MTYATCDDLVTRFGEMKLTQLTDRAVPPARCPDNIVMGTALADATETIDGYAATRYRTPLCPVPAPVRKWCADMALYYLHTATTAPEGVRKSFEDALTGLKDMARGVIVFQSEGVPTVNTPAEGVRLETPVRVFTPDSLKGF